MKITHKIDIHLDDKRRLPPIDVMQGDANTRLLEFTLYSGSEAWPIPDGVSVTVAYCGASGQGAYDTLQDDATKAYSVSGNVVTVTLIPQVAAVAGNTTVSVVFTDAAGSQLATFGVSIRVERNPAIGSGKPEFYYNLREWIGAGALDVQISSDGGSSDATYAEIVAAHNAGRSVSCHFQDYVLPLMIAAPSAVIFQSIANRNYVRVLITPDGAVRYSSGQYALMTDLDAKQDKAPATDAKYFGITDDGVVYLQPEYRGASTSSSMTLAMSDKGKGVAGSKNGELPEEIIIPEIVNEIAVTAYADGMFFCNNRIKRLVLLPSVKVIPKQFCAKCLNLEDVSGTENVEVLGNATFAYSTLGKASFPSLKTLDGTSHFGYCAKLVVADIGNVVTKIPDSLFVGCERLSCLRNAEKVTVVGANSFAFTHRLKTLPFLPNLTSIGAGGIFISRVAYDWGSLTGCAFGAKSTPKDINTTDFWTGRTFEACNTPMRSTFEQHDPRWADEEINGTLTASGSVAKFKEGCNLVSAAMAYSALAGVDMDSPAEFTEMAHGIDASLRTMEYDEMATTKAYLEAMGCTVTHRADYNAATLQEMYDALADGALVISSVLADASSGSTGHVVVFHGINEGGELLVVDPSSPARNIGIYEAITYPMPVQNRVRAVDDFLIVRKEV